MSIPDGRAEDAARARASHLTPVRELQQFAMGVERKDIRGWAVSASDGVPVGVVERLLVETGSGKIRYATVALTPEPAFGRRRGAGGSVLVPIGLVHLEHDQHHVVIDSLTASVLSDAPRLYARPITRADEDEALAAYGMATSREVGDHQLYLSPQFDERRLHRPAEL
jgi:hypothetical protein